MAEAEFSPPELDRLEDALEDLERDGAWDRGLDDASNPRIRERLADYRSLLALSREALPMEDVPPGLLDGVLAEAKQAAAVAPAREPRPSLWARWRRGAFIPAVALAGTAALVLWIGRSPGEPAALEESPAAPSSALAPAAQDAKTEPAAGAADAMPPRSDPADSAAPPPPATAAPAQPRQSSRSAGPGDRELGASAPGSSRDAPSHETKTDARTANENEADEDEPLGPASGRWDLITRADRMRRAGDCVAAREDYAVALEDDEPGVRARAFAGMGLCDRQAGNAPAADANFERARELDGGIDGFIESQRARKPARRRSGKKRKAKAKPSPSSRNAMDPFE